MDEDIEERYTYQIRVPWTTFLLAQAFGRAWIQPNLLEEQSLRFSWDLEREKNLFIAKLWHEDTAIPFCILTFGEDEEADLEYILYGFQLDTDSVDDPLLIDAEELYMISDQIDTLVLCWGLKPGAD